MGNLARHLSALGEVQAGEPLRSALSAERVNAIIGAIKALAAGENLVPGYNMTVTRSPAGVVIRSKAAPVAGGAAVATTDEPFRIVEVSGAEDPTIKINYGEVNNIAPTNIEDEFALVDDGTYVVYLEVEVDVDWNLVSAYLYAEIGAVPDDDATYGYLSLGTVTVLDGAITAINTSRRSSFWHAKCGIDVHQFWRA